MALLISFENPEVVEAIQDRVDGMTQQVGLLHLEVPAEFVAWQTEDMNRQIPNIETADEGWLKRWTTRIWPRSRASQSWFGKKRVRGPRKRKTQSTFAARLRARVSGPRPILRDELFEMLRERMRALLDKVSWKQS